MLCSKIYGSGNYKRRNLVLSTQELPNHDPEYDNFETDSTSLHVPASVCATVDSALQQLDSAGVPSFAAEYPMWPNHCFAQHAALT